jgi:hypothetical protein
MKTVLKFVIGLVVVPVASMALFVLVNWVLSLLFNSDFQSLNHSSIWMIEGLLVIAFVIVYLTYVLDED